MPPSLMMIFKFGYFTAYPDHSHSAHALSDSWPNNVAPSGTIGEPGGMSATPVEPDVQADHRVGVGARVDDRVPPLREDRLHADAVRHLRQA